MKMKHYGTFRADDRVVYKTAGRPVEYGYVTGAGEIGVFVKFDGDTGTKLCSQDLFSVRDWYEYITLLEELDLREID